MKRPYLYIVLFILLLPSLTYAAITRTLKQGDRGIDVKELQVFLNSDPDTRIAASGVGSPGKESMYFGALTSLAVKRFQTKYAYETLTPAGLSTPTGVVGYYTRLLVAKMIQTKSLATPIVPTQSTSSTIVTITSINPSVVTNYPQTITITGSGFTEFNNTVRFSSESEGGTTVSGTPTTISVPFYFSLAQKIRSQIGTGVSKDLIVKNLSGDTIVRENGTTYVRVILTVKNIYGESAPASFLVDIKSLL